LKIKTKMVILVFLAIVFVSLIEVNAQIQPTPFQPKLVQKAEAANPPIPKAPYWPHETGVGFIYLPNPQNNSTFQLAVNVTVLSNSFVQGSPAFIVIDITIPSYMVPSFDIQAIVFGASIQNALQANASQAFSEPFEMLVMSQNLYFPEPYVKDVIPYDWTGQNYIVLQNAGQINLTLDCPIGTPEYITPTPDWSQHSNFTTSLTIPLITINPIQAPTPPEKTIFNQVVNDPNNLLYISFLGFGGIADLILAVCLAYYRKTNKPIINKLLLSAPVAFLSLFFLPDLLYYRPYDLNVFQIIAIGVIWIVGTMLVVIRRNKLPFSFFRGKKKKKQESSK